MSKKEKQLLNFQYSVENKEKLKILAELDNRTLSSFISVILDNVIKQNSNKLLGLKDEEIK